MTIGVGVITCGVRSLPVQFTTPGMLDPETTVLVEYDEQREGAGVVRNRVLRRLYDVGAQHFFLFDDDCYPVVPGWERYFIESPLVFCGLPEIFKSKYLGSAGGEVVMWDSIVGCFNYQTRTLLDHVGGYDAGYRGYGYEDTGRNQRIKRYFGTDGYMSLLRAPAYIHSMDVFGEHPAPHLSEAEKTAGIARNRPVLLAENASSEIYRPF